MNEPSTRPPEVSAGANPDPDPARAEAVEAFLRDAGWAEASRAPLAGDASNRRYMRLALDRRSAVLMDARGSDTDQRSFAAVTAWLRGEGFSAPQIYHAEPKAGLVLMEDLGDDLFCRVLAANPSLEPQLYGAAIDLLVALHDQPPPRPTAEWYPEPYDAPFLLREARLALDWYIPAATGAPVPEAAAASFDAILLDFAHDLGRAPPVAVLRDYHAENLLWLPGRSGHARVGLLDYQGMLVGHRAYDLVSLLEDARRDTGPELRAAMRKRYCAAMGCEPETFGCAASFLAAQRNLKILGIFTRLARRDGKRHYLRHMPRVWAHLQGDLEHPSLERLRDWCAILPAPTPDILARLEAPPA